MRRSGFTLIEVTVTLAIVSLLAAMLLPAVQSVREQSRAVTCTSQLRQVGLACTQFEAAQRRYPSYLDRERRGVSGHVQLLPYLGEAPLLAQVQFSGVGAAAAADPPSDSMNANLLRHIVQTLVCPSDNRDEARCSYRACFGTTPGIHADWKPGHGALFSPETKALWGVLVGARGPAEVIDGLSNTVLYSERVAGDGDSSRYQPFTDVAVVNQDLLGVNDTVNACRSVNPAPQQHFSSAGFVWLLGTYEHVAYNHILPPNSQIPDCVSGMTSRHLASGAISARSNHVGFVTVCFADGAVRKVSNSVDLIVWRAIATIHGGEIANEF